MAQSALELTVWLQEPAQPGEYAPCVALGSVAAVQLESEWPAYLAVVFVQYVDVADSIVVRTREGKSKLLGLKPAFASIAPRIFCVSLRRLGILTV